MQEQTIKVTSSVTLYEVTVVMLFVAEPPAEPDALLASTSNGPLVCIEIDACVRSVEYAPVSLFRWAFLSLAIS